MFGRSRSARAPEDPAVALVEQMFESAAARNPVTGQPSRDRPAATHALWICACITIDDAPTWLLYDTDEDGIAWCRVPDGLEPLDLVEARLSGGGHADPGEVLLWLQGKRSEPWGAGGGGDADAGVLEEFVRKIRRS